MDTIRLSGMQFFAHHGVFGAEAELGARFVVDVEYRYPFPKEDDLSGAVSYAEVYASVQGEMQRRCQLIERLAANIAGRLLREQPRVTWLRVTVHKPGAPIPGIFGDVSATVERQREP